MKKAIIAVVLIFGIALVPSLVSAQTYGINAGVNIANCGGDDADNTDSKTGFMFGALMNYPLSANGVGLRIEANFTQKGFKQDYGVDIEDVLKLSYLEIPVLLQYKAASSGSIAPIFFAGPAAALKLSAKLTEKVGSQEDTETADLVKGFDLGLMIGGGICVNNMFNIYVRYTMGLTTISDRANTDIKNNVITIGGSYIL